MKIVENDVFCGSIEPQAVVSTPCSITRNYGIKSHEVEDPATHTKYNVWTIAVSETEFYESFVNALAETSSEHDELIAELIEGGATE